jgi:hypothetical protein
MSPEDERQAKALALLEFEEQRQRHALLKNEAHKLAEALRGVAKTLDERPETLKLAGDDEVLRDYRRLGPLLDDILKTEGELRRLGSTLEKAGLRSAVVRKD